MRDCNQRRFRRQIRFLRRQFLQDGDLPFSNLLSGEVVEDALTAVDVVWNDRIYTPLVTLWVFLSQVMSADHSCRAAVARSVAHRVANGQSPCSAETGAYCQARKRLPEKFFSAVTRLVGRRLEQPGFRTKEIIVVTTLLDPETTTKEDLASLYRSRWSQEMFQAECTSRTHLSQLTA